MANEELARCRWVWLIDQVAPWPSILDRLLTRGMRCECVPDPEQRDRDLRMLMGGDGSAPAAAFGRAVPRGVVPPKRVGQPPPPSPETKAAALRAAGLPPDYVEKAPELRSK